MEVVKWIPGHEGRYSITDDGRVFSYNHRRYGITELKPYSTGKGYLHVDIGGKNRKVHRLVAESFLPNPDNLPEVNHIDEVKGNNFSYNLEWCTHKHNNICSWENGRQSLKGTEHHASKLSDDDVLAIRAELESHGDIIGTSGKGAAIARKYGVSRGIISKIKKRKLWRHL